MTVVSKLPEIGLSVFSEMTALANQVGATNLAQGFPNFDPDKALLEYVTQAIAQGINQYAPMAGNVALRQQLSAQSKLRYGFDSNFETEITITAGGCEAIFCAIHSIIKSGDEVIVLEPCYDSYVPAIKLAGGIPVGVNLTFPTYKPDWDSIRKAITHRTKAIIINTPHNPSGCVWEQSDILELEKACRANDLCVISDEVYEHQVYDENIHYSVLKFPELRSRSFMIGSFGKSLHVTGWKIGYCIAPEVLMREFRKVHQFVNFSVSSPMQAGIAKYLEFYPAFGYEIGSFYQQKRNLFETLMIKSNFIPLPSQGTFFKLYGFKNIKSDMSDTDFCKWLATEHKVAAIPLSRFYQVPLDNKIIRFCFAKTQETLLEASERLCRL